MPKGFGILEGVHMKIFISRAFAAAIVVAFVAPAYAATVLPSDTTVIVAPVDDITSKKMKEGDIESFQVVNDVVQNGVVVIPRGTPAKGKITWRTGKGVGGKSAKFEVTFTSLSVNGHEYALKGKHRQEGKGNTVAALLGSMLISGHSAVMEQGQATNALTAEPITID
jgi:hypothetical protein